MRRTLLVLATCVLAACGQDVVDENKTVKENMAAMETVECIRPDYDKPNYDESKIAPYTLEDPLTFADGTKLKGPEDLREGDVRSGAAEAGSSCDGTS